MEELLIQIEKMTNRQTAKALSVIFKKYKLPLRMFELFIKEYKKADDTSK